MEDTGIKCFAHEMVDHRYIPFSMPMPTKFFNFNLYNKIRIQGRVIKYIVLWRCWWNKAERFLSRIILEAKLPFKRSLTRTHIYLYYVFGRNHHFFLRAEQSPLPRYQICFREMPEHPKPEEGSSHSNTKKTAYQTEWMKTRSTKKIWKTFWLNWI